MTYAVINPESVVRAARDMSRLSKEIIELSLEAANGLAAPHDGIRIEEAAIEFKDLADRCSAYVKAVLKQAADKAKVEAEKAKAEADKSVKPTAKKKAAKAEEPKADEAK